MAKRNNISISKLTYEIDVDRGRTDPETATYVMDAKSDPNFENWQLKIRPVWGGLMYESVSSSSSRSRSCGLKGSFYTIQCRHRDIDNQTSRLKVDQSPVAARYQLYRELKDISNYKYLQTISYSLFDFLLSSHFGFLNASMVVTTAQQQKFILDRSTPWMNLNWKCFWRFFLSSDRCSILFLFI